MVGTRAESAEQRKSVCVADVYGDLRSKDFCMRVLYVFTMNNCKVSDAQIVRFVALSLSVEQILYGYIQCLVFLHSKSF